MKLFAGVLLAAILIALWVSSSKAATQDVILLYGWNGNTSSWNTTKVAYEAKGYTVHILSLPRAGSNAGDTIANANYVESYISSHQLDNVQLDGHSLGGWLALYLTLVRTNPAIYSVVLRDTGYGCWFNIPADQCTSSSLLQAINSAPVSTVQILNLSSKSTQLPQVDCTKVYNLSHNDFLTNSAVNSAATSWPITSPCTSPVPTPTPTPCSWWQHYLGYC